MIIQTTRISRSGGVGHLARHLLDKTRENDAIEILAGDRSALFDAHTLASFKGCKYSVRHIAVSPEREMTPPQLSEFMRSINSEFCVGAERPRLIVRHVKKGRSHFHIAVAEVDPKTLRVLDCRNDYARLEDIARRYEEKHGETIQPTRADRHQRKSEGFSDVARKRAERVTPAFDRTKLKQAFGVSPEAFHSELGRQGLEISPGEKGPILINSSGAFVAAANRVVGRRRDEFSKFMEVYDYGRNYFRIPEVFGNRRTQDRETVASAVTTGDAGHPGQDSPVPGASEKHTGRTETTGRSLEALCRSTRSSATPLIRRLRPEQSFLRHLGTLDTDALLRRAEEMAAWVRLIFEPPAQRLTRKIQDLKRDRRPNVSAEVLQPLCAKYDLKRRI
ncbi:MAG: relaxase/mobilization nuclease domain-containing protein [Hoeflea sp.]|nr:relaxase/mobilization nuclease domain-containing protein [Hoeflea sp.]